MVEINATPPDEDAVLREVWNTKNIEAKTELNPIQIESVNKLLLLSTIMDNELLRTHLKTFMKLQKSKNRKSMDEFVSVVKAKREDVLNKGKGFFNSFMG